MGNRCGRDRFKKIPESTTRFPETYDGKLQEQLQFKSLTGPSVACVLWWASIVVPRRNVFEFRFDFSL